jgi:chromosome segregation ATPase
MFWTRQIRRVRTSQELARSNGAAIDGINLTGGTSQFATSAAAVAFALMKALDNPDGRYRSRLKRLANLATQQANRLDQLFNRAEDLAIAAEPNDAEVTPPDIAEPFTEAANVLTRQTNKLSKTLDSSLETLQPLQLDRKAAINEQLNQIKEYLQQLSQRLDKLEEVMARLEQQVTEQSEALASLESSLPIPQNGSLDVLDVFFDEQPSNDHALRGCLKRQSSG